MWASTQLYNAAHPLGPGPHLGSDNFVQHAGQIIFMERQVSLVPQTGSAFSGSD